MLRHILCLLRGDDVGIRLFFPDWLSSERNEFFGENVKNLRPIPVREMYILKTVPSFSLAFFSLLVKLAIGKCSHNDTIHIKVNPIIFFWGS